MNRFLSKNQEGYVLLTVLIMFVIVSILGLSLMSYTVGSVQFSNKNKEFIQTKSEAEMKAQEVKSFIIDGVDEVNKNIDSLDMNALINRIEKVLSDAEGFVGGAGTLEIKTIKDGSDGVLLKQVDIKIGADDLNRDLIKTIIITTMADYMFYNAYTPGHFILNGSTYFTGNIQVGKDISVDNQAHLTEENKWVETAFPGIDGKLNVVGDYYLKDRNSTGVKFDPTLENLEKYFSIPPDISKRSSGAAPLDIDTIVIEQKNVAEKVGKGFNTYKPEFVPEEDTTFEGDYKFNKSVSIEEDVTVHVKGDMLIKDNLELEGTLIVDGTLYVLKSGTLSGEIQVDADSYVYIGGTATLENLTVNGYMYVLQDLQINGPLHTNGAIYVKSGGSINVYENDDGKVIVYSQGPLTIGNDGDDEEEDEEEDKTYSIKGYFYSNQELILDGVISKWVIHGGVYGKNITMNAVKGKTTTEKADDVSQQKVGEYYIETPQSALTMNQSRLKILYDEDLILNPPKGLPEFDEITVREMDSHFYDR
ncbi:hypothetical protein [Halobacillus yeomjeoni]|uniref:Uncharacterized protein n=1 Tax=Halobacillus yeomjeoni TaxID=311194 RepID=A0A931HV27_9BACI|nr:hypothetical protein [Halobacillus yeomjeoni]MBH0230033.1 hypothetical protein [Halobacillus yeomjeoni]